MPEYLVRCTMGDGVDALVAVQAGDADDAREQVLEHRRLFYGSGDGAGRWLAARKPSMTVVDVHEAALASGAVTEGVG